MNNFSSCSHEILITTTKKGYYRESILSSRFSTFPIINDTNVDLAIFSINLIRIFRFNVIFYIVVTSESTFTTLISLKTHFSDFRDGIKWLQYNLSPKKMYLHDKL